VPIDTSFNSSDQIPTRFAQLPTFSETSIPHLNLPPTRPHPIFPQKSANVPPTISHRNLYFYVFANIHDSDTRQLPHPSNVQLPTSTINAQIPKTTIFRQTSSASPTTTAGVDIFHSLHSPCHQSVPKPLPTFPGSDSNPIKNTISSNIRPSQLMTPDQITRMFCTTTAPPHQAHLDTSHTSRITTTVSTRLKTLIPHRSPLIHTPDSSDGTRYFDLQCLAADFYLTVYNGLFSHFNVSIHSGNTRINSQKQRLIGVSILF